MIMEPDFHNSHKLEDEVLYLYLLSKMPNQRLETLQGHKLVFLTKYFAFQKKEMIFQCKFFMRDKGPVAQHLYDVRDTLNEQSLISITEEPRFKIPAQISNLTKASQYILEECENLFLENEWAFAYLKDVASEYGPIPVKDLRFKVVYKLPYQNRLIENIPYGTPFDFAIPKTGKVFRLSKDWEETILLLKNPNFKSQMDQMFTELKDCTFAPFKELQ